MMISFAASLLLFVFSLSRALSLSLFPPNAHAVLFCFVRKEGIHPSHAAALLLPLSVRLSPFLSFTSLTARHSRPYQHLLLPLPTAPPPCCTQLKISFKIRCALPRAVLFYCTVSASVCVCGKGVPSHAHTDSMGRHKHCYCFDVKNLVARPPPLPPLSPIPPYSLPLSS
jgi:hypothetical protein